MAATLDHGNLYCLCDISNFGTPYHLRIFSCPFGTMDTCAEGTFLFADRPVKIDNYIENVRSAELHVANGRIMVELGGKKYLFTSDETNAYTMKDEYAAYYDNSIRAFDVDIDGNIIPNPDVVLKRGMLL